MSVINLTDHVEGHGYSVNDVILSAAKIDSLKQRTIDKLEPIRGQVVFNIDLKLFGYYNGSEWVYLKSTKEIEDRIKDTSLNELEEGDLITAKILRKLLEESGFFEILIRDEKTESDRLSANFYLEYKNFLKGYQPKVTKFRVISVNDSFNPIDLTLAGDHLPLILEGSNFSELQYLATEYDLKVPIKVEYDVEFDIPELSATLKFNGTADKVLNFISPTYVTYNGQVTLPKDYNKRRFEVEVDLKDEVMSLFISLSHDLLDKLQVVDSNNLNIKELFDAEEYDSHRTYEKGTKLTLKEKVTYKGKIILSLL